MDLRDIAITLGGLYVTGYTLRSATIHLEHFAPAEFGASWPVMATPQLEALDAFRRYINRPIEISPAKGALARTLAPGDATLHNVTRYGRCYASDVLIPEGMTLEQAYELALEADVFGGIGVYPDWHPREGLHVDTRHLAGDKAPPGDPSDPATWSGLDVDDGHGGTVQDYFAAAEAFREQRRV